MNPSPRVFALIPAAGSGTRMGSDIPKQYMPLAGADVISHAMAPFLKNDDVTALVVVLARDDAWWGQRGRQSVKPVILAIGGQERCHSVFSGLDALAGTAADDDWVIVHDAARPCLASSDLKRLLTVLADDPVGGFLAFPVEGSLKRSDADGSVVGSIPCGRTWHALTPQMFRYGRLRQAMRAALAAGVACDDESAAMEYAGHRPRVVEARSTNIRIVGPNDLQHAECILVDRRLAF